MLLKAVGAIFLLLAAYTVAIIGHAFYRNAEAAESARSFCDAVAIGADERSVVTRSAGSEARHTETADKHVFRYQGGHYAVSCVVTVRDHRVTGKSVSEE